MTRPGAPSDGALPSSTLDSIFDGIDINVPTAPPKMSDPALEAGDFMIGTPGAGAGGAGPHEQPPPPPPPDPSWGGSSTTDLGADLLAAFNAADPMDGIPGMDGGMGSMGGMDVDIDMGMGGSPGLPPPAPGPDPVVSFDQNGAVAPLTDRLEVLASALRREGRTVDADLVTEAMALIKLQS